MLENARAHFSKSLFWYWSSWSVYHQESFSKRDCSNHENCNIKFPLNTFSNQITICQISFEIYTSFTSNSSSKQIQFGCLPFLFSFFSWKTINKQGIIDKIRPEIHIVRRNIVELETWLRQKQLLQVFYEKDVLESFAKFTGKHLCQSLFLSEVAGLSHCFCWENHLRDWK